LPEWVDSGAIVGKLSRKAARLTGLVEGTPLVAGGGDQQCAALGLGVLEPESAALCIGTAGVISHPSGRPVLDAHGKFFCTAHAAPGRFVLEGILNSFGSSLQWAVATLGLSHIAELEQLASNAPPGAGGTLFIPYLAGVGSPDHNSAARGIFAGLDLSTSGENLARAVFEGLSCETARILDAMDPGGFIRTLHLSGGLATVPFMASSLADLTGRNLLVSQSAEASLAGAAILAWTGAGAFESVSKAALSWASSLSFETVVPERPEASKRLRTLYNSWATRARQSLAEDRN